MLDLFHIPKAGYADIQVFSRPSLATSNQFYQWHKPRGASMVSMIAIGGGGGGGGGFSGVAGSQRGGGGGGGSSGMTRLIIPAMFLPDTAYVMVGGGGGGGVGGAPGQSGSGGFLSYVTANWALTTDTNVILSSANVGATGGGRGDGTGGGGGGGAASAATILNMPLGGVGLLQGSVGLIGAAGGDDLGAIGGAVAFQTTGGLILSGTGGAGTTSADFAGGIITGIANSLISEKRPQGAAAGSNNGAGGYLSLSPFFSYPGMGGGSSNTGVGGHGGKGGPGAGGGGGGGGTTGGNGGDGGDGLVVIISW